MYRELRFKTILNEASASDTWLEPDEARALLDEKTIALINQDLWTEAFATTRNQTQRNAEIDLFVDTTMKPYKNNLLPGIDIIRSIIQQLGFKETENPYLKFIQKFFKSNSSVQITREGWIALNDFLANDIITESVLFGTGHDGDKHLVFNPYLYTTSEFKNSTKNLLQIMKDYEYLSKKENIENLNMKAIYQAPSNPFKQQIKALNLVFTGEGKIIGTVTNDIAKKIRNIFIFKDPNNPMGELNDIQTLYWVNKAISLGDNLSNGQPVDKDEEINTLIKNINSGVYSKDQLQSVYDYLTKLGYKFSS